MSWEEVHKKQKKTKQNKESFNKSRLTQQNVFSKRWKYNVCCISFLLTVLLCVEKHHPCWILSPVCCLSLHRYRTLKLD